MANFEVQIASYDQRMNEMMKRIEAMYWSHGASVRTAERPNCQSRRNPQYAFLCRLTEDNNIIYL